MTRPRTSPRHAVTRRNFFPNCADVITALIPPFRPRFAIVIANFRDSRCPPLCSGKTRGTFSYFLLERGNDDQPASKLSPRNSLFPRANFRRDGPFDTLLPSRKLHIICRQRVLDGSCRLKATVKHLVFLVRSLFFARTRIKPCSRAIKRIEIRSSLRSSSISWIDKTFPFLLLLEEEERGGTFARVGRVICLIALLREALVRVTRPRVAAAHAPLNRNSRPLTRDWQATKRSRFFHPPIFLPHPGDGKTLFTRKKGSKLKISRMEAVEGEAGWDYLRNV